MGIWLLPVVRLCGLAPYQSSNLFVIPSKNRFSLVSDLEFLQDVIKEYRRFDTNQLVAPPKERVSLLADECFSIWVVEAQPLLPLDLAEQRPLEERILEL